MTPYADKRKDGQSLPATGSVGQQARRVTRQGRFPASGAPIFRLTLALAATLMVGVVGGQSGSVHQDLQSYIRTQVAALGSPATFSFGVYSDIHMIESPTAGMSRAAWQRLLAHWRDDGNLFGLIIGDLGYGYATDINNVLSGPLSVPGAPPIFYSMGNHELDGVGKRSWIDGLYPGAVRPTSWTNVAQVAPGNADRAYFSFDVGPYTHFIVLDGNYMTWDGYNARAWQSLGQAQLAWLAADIRANPTKNILVFVHEPIDQQVNGSTPYYVLTDRGGLLDLLNEHPKQAFVFSGHFHAHGGITRWRGVTSVHVNTGSDPSWGVRVTVNGDQIAVTTRNGAIPVTEFDQHPMNQVTLEGNQYVQRVAEDGAPAGFTRGAKMTVAGAENGVAPVAGTSMLKTTAMTWYHPRFISEQLIKIRPGMKFSYDIYLQDVINGRDAVTVQPDWYTKDGTMPPLIVDQNGVRLSRRTNDGRHFLFNEDVPLLAGRATGRWYHREFDLAAMAGHYVDGLYLASEATNVNVGTVYVDNIRFTWPAAAGHPPTVQLLSPVSGTTAVELATFTVDAAATDSDGSIARVDFFANAVSIGSRSTPPYSITWSGVAPGAYNLTAVATDNAGMSTTSAPVAVRVDYASGSAAQTLLTTQVPAAMYGNGVDYELGMRVWSNVPGHITAVRFWKPSGDTGVHVGRVWNSGNGQLLASVSFTGETASGWQQQALAAPLVIAANTEYLVSVNTPGGIFPATLGGFTSAVTNGNLSAPTGENGRYGPAGTLPTISYGSANYFRDIVFVPHAGDATPGAQSLFTAQAPVSQYTGAANYELGVRLFADVAGRLTALRFWKVAGDNGPHVGRVWTATGQLLATVTFANETASGWQEQALPSSLPITAYSHYIVTVNTTNNLFPASVSALTTEWIRGNLHAPTGANGVYGFWWGAMPTISYANTNYFRDVVFVPGP